MKAIALMTTMLIISAIAAWMLVRPAWLDNLGMVRK